MAKRTKQLEVPGTERKVIKEIDEAAELFLDKREVLKRAKKKHDEAEVALIAVCKKHGLTVYRDDSVTPPLVVHIAAGKEKAKVEALKDVPTEAEVN